MTTAVKIDVGPERCSTSSSFISSSVGYIQGNNLPKEGLLMDNTS